MGRFKQRSEDSSETGYLSGDANNALRLFKEELQVIQRTLLKSLQEDVRRLKIQKDHLVNDVQQLQTEKEDLQKDKQIIFKYVSTTSTVRLYLPYPSFG